MTAPRVVRTLAVPAKVITSSSPATAAVPVAVAVATPVAAVPITAMVIPPLAARIGCACDAGDSDREWSPHYAPSTSHAIVGLCEFFGSMRHEHKTFESLIPPNMQDVAVATSSDFYHCIDHTTYTAHMQSSHNSCLAMI